MTRIILIEYLQIAVDRRQIGTDLMRRELDRPVQSVLSRVGVSEALNHEDARFDTQCCRPLLPPASDCFGRFRHQARAIENKQWFPVDANIAFILEVAQRISDERVLIFFAVVLLDENLFVHAIPRACPVLVRPHNAERLIDTIGFGKQVERLVHQSLAVKPVVVKTECLDAGVLSQSRLFDNGVFVSQLIKAQIARDTRLIVAFKAR